MNYFEIGERIETKIVAIIGDTVFVELNMKSEGVIDSAEFLDKDGNLTVKVGDTIKVYFISAENGEMRFTTKLSGDKADAAVLESAYQSGIPVEGVVEKEIKGGFEVKIGGKRAFCPYSQMGFRQKEEAAFFVGKKLTFKIQQFENDGRNIVVSNRAILEAKANEQLASLAETYKEGMSVKGTVVKLQSYGAFIDIKGFQALLPISEISRGRVDDITKVLSEGQEIEAKIIKADWDHERVTLSMKELESDPWDTIAAKYKVGSKYEGTIARITQFGLFVTLEKGIDGLVHISKLKDSGANTNLSKKYKLGTKISVTIEKIDLDERRISLTPSQSTDLDKSTAKYMENQDDDGDTYNPFAALLKK
ncbi:MAG: 30S ribosomal protein S1 [Treponema sp. CETP13]|nr:MAG: 30S ribosomal protein S1 [Treponema sp. CETP13]